LNATGEVSDVLLIKTSSRTRFTGKGTINKFAEDFGLLIGQHLLA
jgi:hypothetical protein